MNGTTTALQKIENAQRTGALVFVDQGGMVENTPLYKLDVTEMAINKDNDCFNISGKFMPKREIVDRIGDACGITFIHGETKAVQFEDMLGKRIVYTAFAQGQKLMPDGTYRQSSVCDYDFDFVLRAMLDFDVTELNESTKQRRRLKRDGTPYGSTLARYILELQKVASQRANTGARLRVIRELAGMPEAFTEPELKNPLYFGRMIQNTEYILKTPEGRAMATAKALGVDVAALFGGKAAAAELPAQRTAPAASAFTDVTPETGASAEQPRNPAPQQSETIPDFEDLPPRNPPPAAREQGQNEFDRLTQALVEYHEGYAKELNVTIQSNGVNPYLFVEAELNNQNATIETRRDVIERTRAFLLRKGCKV